jgi:uncharacterized membrane protein YkgB
MHRTTTPLQVLSVTSYYSLIMEQSPSNAAWENENTAPTYSDTIVIATISSPVVVAVVCEQVTRPLSNPCSFSNIVLTTFSFLILITEDRIFRMGISPLLGPYLHTGQHEHNVNIKGHA